MPRVQFPNFEVDLLEVTIINVDNVLVGKFTEAIVDNWYDQGLLQIKYCYKEKGIRSLTKTEFTEDKEHFVEVKHLVDELGINRHDDLLKKETWEKILLGGNVSDAISLSVNFPSFNLRLEQEGEWIEPIPLVPTDSILGMIEKNGKIPTTEVVLNGEVLSEVSVLVSPGGQPLVYTELDFRMLVQPPILSGSDSVVQEKPLKSRKLDAYKAILQPHNGLLGLWVSCQRKKTMPLPMFHPPYANLKFGPYEAQDLRLLKFRKYKLDVKALPAVRESIANGVPFSVKFLDALEYEGTKNAPTRCFINRWMETQKLLHTLNFRGDALVKKIPCLGQRFGSGKTALCNNFIISANILFQILGTNRFEEFVKHDEPDLVKQSFVSELLKKDGDFNVSGDPPILTWIVYRTTVNSDMDLWMLKEVLENKCIEDKCQAIWILDELQNKFCVNTIEGMYKLRIFGNSFEDSRIHPIFCGRGICNVVWISDGSSQKVKLVAVSLKAVDMSTVSPMVQHINPKIQERNTKNQLLLYTAGVPLLIIEVLRKFPEFCKKNGRIEDDASFSCFLKQLENKLDEDRTKIELSDDLLNKAFVNYLLVRNLDSFSDEQFFSFASRMNPLSLFYLKLPNTEKVVYDNRSIGLCDRLMSTLPFYNSNPTKKGTRVSVNYNIPKVSKFVFGSESSFFDSVFKLNPRKQLSGISGETFESDVERQLMKAVLLSSKYLPKVFWSGCNDFFTREAVATDFSAFSLPSLYFEYDCFTGKISYDCHSRIIADGESEVVHSAAKDYYYRECRLQRAILEKVEKLNGATKKPTKKTEYNPEIRSMKLMGDTSWKGCQNICQHICRIYTEVALKQNCIISVIPPKAATSADTLYFIILEEHILLVALQDKWLEERTTFSIAKELNNVLPFLVLSNLDPLNKELHVFFSILAPKKALEKKLLKWSGNNENRANAIAELVRLCGLKPIQDEAKNKVLFTFTDEFITKVNEYVKIEIPAKTKKMSRKKKNEREAKLKKKAYLADTLCKDFDPIEPKLLFSCIDVVGNTSTLNEKGAESIWDPKVYAAFQKILKKKLAAQTTNDADQITRENNMRILFEKVNDLKLGDPEVKYVSLPVETKDVITIQESPMKSQTLRDSSTDLASSLEQLSIEE